MPGTQFTAQHIHPDARHALREAFGRAPSAIGWQPGGWLVYALTDGAPPGVVPELLVIALGCLPLPLTENGKEVLRAIVAAQMPGEG